METNKSDTRLLDTLKQSLTEVQNILNQIATAQDAQRLQLVQLAGIVQQTHVILQQIAISEQSRGGVGIQTPQWPSMLGGYPGFQGYPQLPFPPQPFPQFTGQPQFPQQAFPQAPGFPQVQGFQQPQMQLDPVLVANVARQLQVLAQGNYGFGRPQA